MVICSHLCMIAVHVVGCVGGEARLSLVDGSASCIAGHPACFLYFENSETHEVILDHVVYQKLCYQDIREFRYLQNKVGRSNVS